MTRRVVESSGETLIFDDDWNDAEGRVGRMEFTIRPKSRVPPHAHPGTASTFAVVSGVLSVRIGERTVHLGPGDRDHTQPGEVHALWNEGTETAHVITGYNPPLAIEQFLTEFALAPKNPFKIAVLWADFKTVTVPETPLLRLFVTIFAALGRLVGLGGWWSEEVLFCSSVAAAASKPNRHGRALVPATHER